MTAKHFSKWQLQQAKQCLSEVVRRAELEGPQEITKNGQESAWLLSSKDYRSLIQRRKRETLVDFFQRSPHCDLEIPLERSRDRPRHIQL